MLYNPNKLAVLSALKKLEKHAATVPMSALMEKLGNQFIERSVRRWLNELVFEGKVEKSGLKSGTSYRAVSKPIETVSRKNIDNEKKFSFSVYAQKAIGATQKPLLKRKPVAYDAAWVNAYKPNDTFYLSAKNRRILQSLGSPEFSEMPAGTYARKIYNRLLIDLSYKSYLQYCRKNTESV